MSKNISKTGKYKLRNMSFNIISLSLFYGNDNKFCLYFSLIEKSDFLIFTRRTSQTRTNENLD